MNLFDRVKNILLSPKTEWPVIAAEEATMSSLYTGYIMILSAITPIVALIMSGGRGAFGTLVGYALGLLFTAFVAWLVDVLAPPFGGERDYVKSLQLSAYATTAGWIAGVFEPFGKLGAIVTVVAALYSLYTFYLGAPVMGKCTPQKAIAYTIVVVICIAIPIAVIVFATILIGLGGVMR